MSWLIRKKNNGITGKISNLKNSSVGWEPPFRKDLSPEAEE
jgi:hypothetical protein